ncbi:phage head-tail joining protein [Pseudohongiella spirulinae]|uniref:Uncharacterized protein n=1 Tax=Pseudohongiella spirulinae TaxID=1249552 RepID=A0A0S2KEV3_9GAMM|nr:hypothetical protein [Pseudohongiella spirulinae]ALO46580.1 hypothetical protein PS2015_1934 [Pseudohongiella spirulinae]
MSTAAQQLAKIKEAIALGALEIHMNGRRVTYRSLNEMRSIRDELQRQISGSSGPDVLRPTFDKGIE